MMRWPSEYAALIRLGYVDVCSRKACDCGIEVRWFLTPARRYMPLSALKDGRLVPHASICPRTKANHQREDAAASLQVELFAEETVTAKAIAPEAVGDVGAVFAGAGYDPDLDRSRLGVQIERIRAWALGRGWFGIREAREELERLYVPALFPENSIAAQLRNLEKPSVGRLRCKKEKRRRAGPRGPGGMWQYRIIDALACDHAKGSMPRPQPRGDALDAVDDEGRELFFREARRIASMASPATQRGSM